MDWTQIADVELICKSDVVKRHVKGKQYQDGW